MGVVATACGGPPQAAGATAPETTETTETTEDASSDSGTAGTTSDRGETTAADDSVGDITGATASDGPQEDDCAAGPPVHCILETATANHVDPDGAPGKAVGLVVGVANLETRYVAGFGATALGGRTPPSADAIFDIGSVTKVYTGYLLARGIADGDVELTDVLEDTFGPDVPTFRGQSLSLLDLATHTSGLPNYPDNMPNAGPVNPASGYTLPLLLEFLAGHTPSVAPGLQYEYSNLGSGILGQVLVSATGNASYDSLVDVEIAQPYALVDTRVELDAAQQLRKLQGHAQGSPAPAVDIGAPLQGGGSLQSTGDEVLRFFEGALDGTDPAWEMVMVPRRPSPLGTNAFTGLLLNIEDPRGDAWLSKSGGTPGFSSQVVMRTDPPAVVVLLSNTHGTEGLHSLGISILETLGPQW